MFKYQPHLIWNIYILHILTSFTSDRIWQEIKQNEWNIRKRLKEHLGKMIIMPEIQINVQN